MWRAFNITIIDNTSCLKLVHESQSVDENKKIKATAGKTVGCIIQKSTVQRPAEPLHFNVELF
jgi:hypothetical protein